MEYILLQPLPTGSGDRLNVSLIERKFDLTREEEALILHKAGGPFAGFIVKKILPYDIELDACHLSFKLNVYMRQSGQTNMQQVVFFFLFQIFDLVLYKHSLLLVQ